MNFDEKPMSVFCVKKNLRKTYNIGYIRYYGESNYSKLFIVDLIILKRRNVRSVKQNP